jgi:hypothetical protein
VGVDAVVCTGWGVEAIILTEDDAGSFARKQ